MVPTLPSPHCRLAVFLPVSGHLSPPYPTAVVRRFLFKPPFLFYPLTLSPCPCFYSRGKTQALDLTLHSIFCLWTDPQCVVCFPLLPSLPPSVFLAFTLYALNPFPLAQSSFPLCLYSFCMSASPQHRNLITSFSIFMEAIPLIISYLTSVFFSALLFAKGQCNPLLKGHIGSLSSFTSWLSLSSFN